MANQTTGSDQMIPQYPRTGARANAKITFPTSSIRLEITGIFRPEQSAHPYHLIKVEGSTSTVYGWVDAGTFTKA